MDAVVTPLSYVIEFGLIEAIGKFLSRGLNVDAKNTDGDALLHVATKMKNEELVKFLLDSGADVNLKNKKSETALALYAKLHGSRHPSKDTIIEMLSKAGADVSSISKPDNKTTLREAVESGDPDLVQLLINQGADVKFKDEPENWTILHYAAKNVTTEDPRMFEILLSAGAEVNAKSALGLTPLHVLASYETKVPSLFKIIDVLVNYNANFNAMNNDRLTPTDYAIDTPNVPMIRALALHSGINSILTTRYTPMGSVFHQACRKFNLPIVKLLLEDGADINAVDKSGQSPLQIVVFSTNLGFKLYGNHNEITLERLELLQYLLEWNPDVNVIKLNETNILDLVTPDERNKNFRALWKTMIQHLAKLEAMDQTLHKTLYHTIFGRTEYENYYEKCKKELENAKRSTLSSDGDATAFNLLADDPNKLGEYFEKRDLTKECTRGSLVKKFPIYGAHMHKRLTKVVESQKIDTPPTNKRQKRR